MPELDEMWTAYLGAQERLRRRGCCDDAAWGLEGELDGLLATACTAAGRRAGGAARRGASRRRGLLAAAGVESADGFRLYVGGGWEGPVAARLELARVFAAATREEGAFLASLTMSTGGARTSRSDADRKRLQRLRARWRDDRPTPAREALA